MRIGLHTGEVLRHADDFFGHAVNIAARVAAVAHGNGTPVSSLVHELTRSLGTFHFGEPRSVQLRGLPGEHRLYPLVWADAHEELFRTTTELRSVLDRGARERQSVSRGPS